MPHPLNKMLLSLCDQVQKCDDRLGQYSDYEGGELGPTFYLYGRGYGPFKAHCAKAIAEHNNAIALLKKLQKLNETRKP